MPRFRPSRILVLLALGALAAGAASSGDRALAAGAASSGDRARAADTARRRLPTGATLDPAGGAIELGSMPLSMVLSPDRTRIAVVLSGHREQGVQILDAKSGAVLQTLIQPAAFLGAVFSPDGKSLYVSGGNQDVIYRYAMRSGAAALADSIRLEPARVDTASARRHDKQEGVRYPAGLAISRDGHELYVAENLSDSLAVIDLVHGKIEQRLEVGPYPYAVVEYNGGAIVSAWGGSWVAVFRSTAGTSYPGRLAPARRIEVGRHPSAMALEDWGARLYVARASFDRIEVVNLETEKIWAELSDAPPAGPSEGSTPNALALSPDFKQLLVAEADNNAVAVFDVEATSGEAPHMNVRDSLIGRIPTLWYPTGVMFRGTSILVLSGKGPGTGPNPGRKQPGRKSAPPSPHPPGAMVSPTASGADPATGPAVPGMQRKGEDRTYTLDQITGALSIVARPAASELGVLSARVAKANGWNQTPAAASYPPFEHVIYIIRENRTYDQVLSDIPAGDGDTSLVFFPRAVTPNAHELAERFGLFDRFFVNAEVSADGHMWSDAAYAPDYVQKTVASQYSDRGRKYDYDGLNRGKVPGDDVNEPGNGYLWDAALAAHLTVRNYGEFTRHENGRWLANKPAMAPNTDPDFAGWDLDIQDQARADAWLTEFKASVASGTLPALTVMALPNDHTAGAKAKAPTPQAYAADNDLALGRIVEALTHSPFWKNTVVFVLEDDAQDGPDHVDSHRSPLLVISAYNRPGVVHRFANTSDVIATIGAILKMKALSQFDYYGRPLSGVFADTADPAPYTHLVPAVPLDQRNPERTPAAHSSSRLDLEHEDGADENAFNRVLWAAIKGENVPYPDDARGKPGDQRGLRSGQ